MVRWNSGWSGRFLVDFLSVSGGFCGSSRFSVEFWVVVPEAVGTFLASKILLSKPY